MSIKAPRPIKLTVVKTSRTQKESAQFASWTLKYPPTKKNAATMIAVKAFPFI